MLILYIFFLERGRFFYKFYFIFFIRGEGIFLCSYFKDNFTVHDIKNYKLCSTDQNERQIESQTEEVGCVIRAFVSRLQQSVQVSFGVFVKL